jgi:alkanesulfonate monooxygenase SsuD/methylene tetrahydromethanopterin reductase-like flavin-dependent oxidoreductase (luciferase family)
VRPAFAVRFDLRNPAFAGVTGAERYGAALAMAEWADEHGALMVVLSEHHGCDDGYLPSALTMAAAVAARTERVLIQVAAVVASLHDPLRLAEEAAVVDLLSAGRLRIVVAAGYVPDEFDMFGAPPAERGRRVDETIRVLRQSWTGEPFEYRGRTVRVTPPPAQPGGPALAVGGSTPAAARRAARLGADFMPSVPDVWEHYRAERIAMGEPDPGPGFGVTSSFTFVAEDVDRAWDTIGPYALHDAAEYGRWAVEGGVAGATGYERAADVAALREGDHYRVLTPDTLRAELSAAPFPFVMLHPMMGGIPPQAAWESLHLFEREVLAP